MGDEAGVRVMLWWEYRGTGLWVEDPGDKTEWVGEQGGWEILEAGWAVSGELGMRLWFPMHISLIL